MEEPLKDESAGGSTSVTDQIKSKLVLPLGIAVLVSALIFGAMGYYLGVNNNDQGSPTSTKTANSNSPSLSAALPTTKSTANTSTSSTDETANWKTYESDDFGISFKYPPSFGDIKVTKIDSTTNIKNVISPVKGNRVEISFSANKIYASSQSKDYAEAGDRGGLTTELGKTFLGESPIGSNICTFSALADEDQNNPTKNGTIPCMVIINTKTVSTYLLTELGGGSFYGDTYFWRGFVHLRNQNYDYLAFVEPDTSDVAKQTLKKILSTVKSIN